jgi:hypothetical protein
MCLFKNVEVKLDGNVIRYADYNFDDYHSNFIGTETFNSGENEIKVENFHINKWANSNGEIINFALTKEQEWILKEFAMSKYNLYTSISGLEDTIYKLKKQLEKSNRDKEDGELGARFYHKVYEIKKEKLEKYKSASFTTRIKYLFTGRI